ncbi:cation:proton antiporter [Anaerorhabdus furcosa]|uniref:Transporter, CPA2 family n=1 Tax=Anaerorhabdus furcosa TaxID=118967 RepID=A0A1T4KBP2_9FIRM|nr:cation:proton antiporter [Anaerorhabdus furcosa]SJZ39753.1 transporter, CPA2 family [Anaerorhabdus furcosa]
MILNWIVSIGFAYVVGKLVSKIKLPAILGWLIAGMIIGPNAFGLMSNELMHVSWYETILHVLECAVGLMIGSELVWKQIKKSGTSLIITTLTQSLGTFILVSLVFALIFYVMNLPIYLAFVFGGIALATAPAPALSIVREYKTDGPVTKTLIPMAALDDIVGVVVFFTVIAFVARSISGQPMPLYMIPVMILLPLVIGVITGIPTGFLLKKSHSKGSNLAILIMMILVTAGVGYFFNEVVMPSPVLNFMLMGMSFSAAFSNIVPSKQLHKVLQDFNPILGISMIIVILNLGAPLDYKAVFGAGLFTVVYIVVRAIGKYTGARVGATLTRMPVTVQKYLGFTLLPHSGVSLIFTGIAVSVLQGPAPEEAVIIQGTIAAAAVINEIIAVIAAKKGFELANEFNQSQSDGILLD